MLLPSEKLFAFLDDIFIGGERMAFMHAQVESALWDHARIRINHGKTQLWNRTGVFPVGCENIGDAGRRAVLPEIVWRGDQSLPTREQGIRVLGTPLGHGDHVEAEVLTTNEEHTTLLSRIVAVRDLQCAWLLLLLCASARANYLLRVVHPSWSDVFARAHDTSVWNSVRQLLDSPSTQEMMDRAGMSLANGGLGLRSASRDKVCAYLASWADALPTIRERHSFHRRPVVRGPATR